MWQYAVSTSGYSADDRLHRTRPDRTGVGEDVRLVDQGEVLTPGLRQRERVAHHPLGTEPGVDRHLGRDLVRGADADRATVAGVRTLGALAHDHEIDVRLRRERRLRSRIQLRRTQIHVMIERESHVQQQTTLEHARRRPTGRRWRRAGSRRARGSPRASASGQQLAGGVVARRTEVVLGGLEIRDELPQHLQRLGRDLDTDAVTGNDRKLHERLTSIELCACHETGS